MMAAFFSALDTSCREVVFVFMMRMGRGWEGEAEDDVFFLERRWKASWMTLSMFGEGGNQSLVISSRWNGGEGISRKLP
jgi:hypothetical protein